MPTASSIHRGLPSRLNSTSRSSSRGPPTRPVRIPQNCRSPAGSGAVGPGSKCSSCSSTGSGDRQAAGGSTGSASAGGSTGGGSNRKPPRRGRGGRGGAGRADSGAEVSGGEGGGDAGGGGVRRDVLSGPGTSGPGPVGSWSPAGSAAVGRGARWGST